MTLNSFLNVILKRSFKVERAMLKGLFHKCPFKRSFYKCNFYKRFLRSVFKVRLKGLFENCPFAHHVSGVCILFWPQPPGVPPQNYKKLVQKSSDFMLGSGVVVYFWFQRSLSFRRCWLPASERISLEEAVEYFLAERAHRSGRNRSFEKN